MNLKKTLFFSLLLFLLGFNLNAQDNRKTSKISLKTDFVSRHIWRASASGTAPTVETSLEYSSTRFTIGSWGALAFDHSYQEVDFYVKYKTTNFVFAIYDYYCPSTDFNDSKFFDFDSRKTKHTFDAQVKLKASKSFPISIMTSILLAGDDRNISNNNRYSAYIELEYSRFVAGKKISWALGLTPYKGMYYKQANIVNINMHVYDNIKIANSFEIPVKAGITLNPINEKLYFTVAFSI